MHIVRGFYFCLPFDNISPNEKCYVSLQTHLSMLGTTVVYRVESQTKVVKTN